MNAVLKYAARVVLTGLLSASVATAVQAQSAQELDCTKDQTVCRLVITVDNSNESKSPSVGHEKVWVDPKQQVIWQGNTRTLVVFPEETPFVDSRGEPIYHFSSDDTDRLLTIRDHPSDRCPRPYGCSFKYIVIDTSNPRRPPLDPYIIILR